MKTAAMFDGPGARLMAQVMARRNRDAEREAIDVLDPRPSDRVVAIGVGAGVGVELLARRVAFVFAVDPSRVMVDETTRRNRVAVDAGRVAVARSTAARLAVDDGDLDGAIAVNSIQMWEPLAGSLAEVARVLRPGGRLVTLTHDWAIERSTGRSVDSWLEHVDGLAATVGLGSLRSWRARSEGGRSVALELTRDGGR
ncbi:MAG: methyltransferase domain-containing protein [Acidimicrobiales bacterium]|nr:methyltransferase domain-containing protein [Acidimicrobiales bacterium]MCB9393299.1 methyltransferase domain-containing protein [Acidimicrobiaceae bacterium]